MKKILLLCSIVLIEINSFGQNWIEKMSTPGHNFYEIQKDFYEYWKGKDITEKGIGYKPFKRWEYFMEKRVYPTGDLSLVSQNWKNYSDFVEKNMQVGRLSNSAQIASATWTAMGPMGAPTGSVGGFPRKAGRSNFMYFHPSTSNTMWIGTPAGGLWKTTNGGSSWTTNTDNLSVIGCTDLVIDPTNSNTMYLATGDGYGNGDTYSIGVLKSIDGGLTWNTTGLVFSLPQQRQMRRLLINPNNPQIVIAGTSAGIFRTINGGTSWTQVSTNGTYDLEFKPGDPNIVYAGGTSFAKSIDAGATFVGVSSGISTNAQRMSIAVTTADPNYVYVVASNSSNNGLLGVYRSTNSGTGFTTMMTSPDILANPCNSNPSGNAQGWYDLSIASSPLNKDEVVVGGVNIWRSLNGGASFSMIGCWIGTGNPPYVHADIHELEYNSTGTLYSSNDGGIFRYTGSAWTDLTNPMNIAQIYKIGLSGVTANKWITGHQDNGTNIFTNGNYVASLAGDGMDCFIDRTNDNNVFASQYNGNLWRSTNGGSGWANATNGITGTGAWVTPWKQDPQSATTLYAGTTQMFVSNNLGASWTPLTNTGGSGTIVEFAIAPSNNQVMYVIHGTAIRKSINGGSTWTSVTGIPTSQAAPTFITISPTDPNKVWITCSGYSAANKVFQTVNGGTNWTNVTYNLPNLPANCSVYQPGSSDIVYVGMDVGVYYRDLITNSWTLYSAGLPNTPISDMEISAANPSKLRAATYGRGVYEVDVYQVTTAPITNFTYSGSICTGNNVILKDASSNSPNGWSWSVAPSTGYSFNSATVQNPTVNFTNPGTYTVSLVSSNNIGSGNTYTKTITVFASPVMTVTGINSNTVCIDEEINMNVSGVTNFTWMPGFIINTTNSFTAATSQAFTLTGVDGNNCFDQDTMTIVVSRCEGIAKANGVNNLFNVFPNPSNGKFNISTKSQKYSSAELEIFDISGRLVLKQTLSFKDKNEIEFNATNLSNGVYSLKIKTSDNKVQIEKMLKE